jgi:hypothetical protein
MTGTVVALRKPKRPRRSWWWLRAACRGQYSSVEGEDLFFDYGHNKRKIRQAKQVCHHCPVQRECLTVNLWAPRGIFGGYTERERMAILLRLPRLPSTREASKWLESPESRESYYSHGRNSAG